MMQKTSFIKLMKYFNLFSLLIIRATSKHHFVEDSVFFTMNFGFNQEKKDSNIKSMYNQECKEIESIPNNNTCLK